MVKMVNTEYAGVSLWLPYAFKKNADTGSLKINIFKVLFWKGGRVHKKSTLFTLLLMLTILGGHIGA